MGLELVFILKGFFVDLSFSSTNFLDWFSLLSRNDTILLLGEVLYTDFLLIFIVSALILLLAMLGTISLTLHHGSGVRSQVAYEQLGREIIDTIKVR